MTRPGALVAILVAGLVLVTGCSPAGPPSGRSTPAASAAASSSGSSSESPGRNARCAKVATTLLGSVQDYVAAYGGTVSDSRGRGGNASSGTSGDLQRALGLARRQLRADACDLDGFRTTFATGLRKVEARGPVAKAVLLRLTASMTGTAVATPSTVTVRPKQDLEAVLATLPSGSTVRLTAGHHRLARSLVLLEGVTLRGAGRDRTTLVSSAGSAGILVLTDGRVELRGLTLRHRGRSASTLLMGGPSSSVVLTAATLTGARSDKHGNGGNGVMMTAAGAGGTSRGTTLQVTGTTIAHNAAAGILLTGDHVASIRGSAFTANGQCGVCFAASSGGAVRHSSFARNAAGVAVLDRARPSLFHDTFTGGQVGVQASGHGAPVVRAARISGVSRAAMIFGGASSGQVDRSRCVKVPYGIVVSPDAYPLVGENSCQLAKGG